MQVKKHYSLKRLNAFKIDVTANEFYTIETVEQLLYLIKEKNIYKKRPFVLGAGFNCLFTKNYDGSILYNQLKGIQKISDSPTTTTVKVDSGEGWQSFVDWAADEELGGVENLTNIPGTVGAAPIQNIGAYGVEVCDTIVEIECVDLSNGRFMRLLNSECEFSYRSSVFKEKYKNKLFITSVTFELQKNPKINTQYKDILEVLKNKGVAEADLNIHFIKDTIAEIRTKKLPDPKIIPNAGSFFKNPIVLTKIGLQLKGLYADMPIYELKNDKFKLSAAWLIDQCELKGFKHKGAGVHENHALVLVNLDYADGESIVELSHIVQQKVNDKFNIKLEPEVNII